MAAYRPEMPPHVAEIVRHLPPDVKRSVKQALRSLSADPFSGAPLMRELSGLWRFKVRTFRILYGPNPSALPLDSLNDWNHLNCWNDLNG